jgi:hypothetical protein
MKCNEYTGVINDRCRLVLVNGDYLLYQFDSPNWGYVGASPARVAEAIMVNELGVDVDRVLINLFLEQKVAKWAGREGWTLTSQEIQDWLKERINV